MPKTKRCAGCGKQLHTGDTAYAQTFNRIRVVGTRVKRDTILELRCPACALGTDTTGSLEQ